MGTPISAADDLRCIDCGQPSTSDLCPACEHVAARLGLTATERASILRPTMKEHQ